VLSKGGDESHKARGKGCNINSKREALKDINMINHRFQDSVFKKAVANLWKWHLIVLENDASVC
jgi:hypothetical protein